VTQKILVVEDNELNLKLFCDLLRAHGYEAEPVRDGREAIARALAFGPDLVVMDIQMPHIGGLELIEAMKADPALKAIPIMAVTAYAAKGDEERIRAAGAEGYVSKPISVMRFAEAVRSLVEAPQSPEREAAPEIRVSRLIPAAPESVFDAWLDPATAGEWLFATPEGEMLSVDFEPRVGGAWSIVERREGEEVLHTGAYEEIDRPRRLVFTLAVPKYSPKAARVAIDIAPVADGGSELTLTQSAPEGATATRSRIQEGWSAVLAALAARLEAGGAEPPALT
jgi:two-component system cell cycle response regulator DivK